MRDLYKFIYLHSLAVVCEESFDKNLNKPKLCAIKISDGKPSDTFVLTLDEREILIFNWLYNHYVFLSCLGVGFWYKFVPSSNGCFGRNAHPTSPPKPVKSAAVPPHRPKKFLRKNF